MATPTPRTPLVENADGSLSVLVFKGRTFRLNATHAGLVDPAGYQARFSFSATYGGPILASATTADSTIVLEQLSGGAGTIVRVTIEECLDGLDVTKGKFDLVIESPSGEETPIVVGNFVTWGKVST